MLTFQSATGKNSRYYVNNGAATIGFMEQDRLGNWYFAPWQGYRPSLQEWAEINGWLNGQ